MSYEKQNFIDGQVLKAEHLNKMEDEIARVKTWNELEGKPFVTVGGDTLEWDGNTEGRTVIDLVGDGSILVTHVSDATPTITDLANGGQVTRNTGEVEEFTKDQVADLGNVWADVANGVFVALQDNADAEGLGMVFPRKGVYLTYNVDPTGDIYAQSLTIPGYTGFTKEQIDPAVLPDALQFGESETGGDTIEWDGSIIGRETIDMAGDGSVLGVHVSDATPTTADFADGGSFILGGGYVTEITAGYTFQDYGNGAFAYSDGLFMVFPTDNFDMGDGFVIPKKGVYFFHMPADATYSVRSLTINGYTGFPGVKKVEEKYLPGAVILYADSSKYLYATSNTSDTTKRITKAELEKHIISGSKILIANKVSGGTTYNIPTYFATTASYAQAAVQGTEGQTIFYTAEYTAS